LKARSSLTNQYKWAAAEGIKVNGWVTRISKASHDGRSEESANGFQSFACEWAPT
jgi:hypothetical protein